MSMWSGKTGEKGTERVAFPLPSFLPLYFRVCTFQTICLGIGDFNLPSPVKATSKSHDQHPARASAFWELRRSRWPGRWPTTVTAKPKVKNLTTKTKYLTAKPKTSRQKWKLHGKTKYFTAKSKYLTAKAIPTAKPKLFCFCCEVFGFAVRFLVLPWGILFLPWGFWFCRDVFVFAVRFLVLPWQLWATIVEESWWKKFSYSLYWTFCLTQGSYNIFNWNIAIQSLL